MKGDHRAVCANHKAMNNWKEFLYIFVLTNPIERENSLLVYGTNGTFLDWNCVEVATNRTVEIKEAIDCKNQVRCPAYYGRLVVNYDQEFYEHFKDKVSFNCLELLPIPNQPNGLNFWLIGSTGSQFTMDLYRKKIVKRSKKRMMFCPENSPQSDPNCFLEQSIEPTFDFYASGFVWRKKLYIISQPDVLIIDLKSILSPIEEYFLINYKLIRLEDFLCKKTPNIPKTLAKVVFICGVIVLCVLSLVYFIKCNPSKRKRKFFSSSFGFSNKNSTNDSSDNSRRRKRGQRRQRNRNEESRKKLERSKDMKFPRK